VAETDSLCRHFGVLVRCLTVILAVADEEKGGLAVEAVMMRVAEATQQMSGYGFIYASLTLAV
jgi:hypothetical protein